MTQEDSLLVTSTPRECIRFSAKLRSPRSTTEEELDALVEKILRDLGLEKCADTMVGGALIKGISGGEKRRTSVGVELVVKPALVFLDEPTSGLDSFAAENLVRVLQGVVKAESTVLCTIHQPSSTVYGLFNHLKEGGADSKEGGADSKRSAALRVSFGTELRLQVEREMRGLRRSKMQLGVRLITTLVIAGLVGFIFFDVGSANHASLSVSGGGLKSFVFYSWW